MDAVAKTALITAAERAMETNRSEKGGALYSPIPSPKRWRAKRKAFPFGRRAAPKCGDQPPAVPLRTRYFDDRILQGLGQGIRQLVFLAAGLDARAYRLSYPEGTRLFELDRKEIFDYKQEKLGVRRPVAGDGRWEPIFKGNGRTP